MTSPIIVYSLRFPLQSFISSLQNPPKFPPPTIDIISMAEEFQESEVVFPDTVDVHDGAYSHSRNRESRNGGRGKRRKLTAAVNKINSSVPVSIPVTAPRIECFNCVEDYDGCDGGEMVPPHVIVGRRVARKMMALLICTGKGRVVKGRDLHEFRNSVLRVTGFLET